MNFWLFPKLENNLHNLRIYYLLIYYLNIKIKIIMLIIIVYPPRKARQLF